MPGRVRHQRAVVVLGARGTYEPYLEREHGLGPTLHALSETIGCQLAAGRVQRRFEVAGIRYPAGSLSYWLSRSIGGRRLTDAMHDAVQRNGRCSFVLLGLSQGADVVRRAMAAEATGGLLPDIVAVVLLGDPTRRPGEGVRSAGDDHSAATAGVLARWATPIPAAIADRVLSCWLPGDRVAANTHGVRGLLWSGSHTGYATNDSGVLDRAAQFVADRLVAASPA